MLNANFAECVAVHSLRFWPNLCVHKSYFALCETQLTTHERAATLAASSCIDCRDSSSLGGELEELWHITFNPATRVLSFGRTLLMNENEMRCAGSPKYLYLCIFVSASAH